jgi:HPt (histidine-containing phosphotransfer) domain-containing protein
LLRVIQKFAPQSAPARVPDAPAATTGEPAVFARQTALDRFDGEEQLFEEVVELFVSDVSNRMAEVRTALEQGDPKRLQNAAHSLKGAAGYVGAERVAAQALKLEELGRRADLSSALEDYAQLEREIEQLKRAVADVMPEHQTI